MAYLEDALGERSWCAHADTEVFVRNILTAFRTDDTDSNTEEKLDIVRLDEKSTTSAVMVTIDFHQYTKTLGIRRRYNDLATRNNIKQITLQTMWEHIPMTVGASAVETSVRSLIKVMMVTCRWVEVRLKAMSCMECKYRVCELVCSTISKFVYSVLSFISFMNSSLARKFSEEC
jgi:hypothetical protein